MEPAFSAGQCPSSACKAVKQSNPLLNAVFASSYVIFSASSTLTRGIFCSNFFSLRNCKVLKTKQNKKEYIKILFSEIGTKLLCFYIVKYFTCIRHRRSALALKRDLLLEKFRRASSTSESSSGEPTLASNSQICLPTQLLVVNK